MKELTTIPKSHEVTTSSKDTWEIDFTNALHPGEAIADGDAILVASMSGFSGVEVPDFVVATDFTESTVTVEWTGDALQPFITYNLLTSALLNTGAVVTLITEVKCVA